MSKLACYESYCVLGIKVRFNSKDVNFAQGERLSGFIKSAIILRTRTILLKYLKI